ncbi:MAG TPA: hypothetical protein DEA43_02015 [Candidatus Moranbacteria bacterium]|nr:hypothetical protein [Candidatus Moranbacteria bacterium]HBT45639.1 hypothetical protein [Candidatus Moranbacteria bacterium]
MQFDFKKLTTNNGQLFSTVVIFWQKIYKTVFFVFLTIVILLSVYVWQRSLSGGQWSAEKKQEFLDAQNKGVVFKESVFNKALSDVEMRKQENVSESKGIKDIFKDY